MGPRWQPIPFFQAVYHASTIVFGNYAGLTYPPYDEKWPRELAPPRALALLDRRYAEQFYLEQARTFAWGMQPMLANFQPSQLDERPEEIDFVTRLVRTRMRSLKYLLHGTWLRPPALEVPEREIDVAQLGVYSPLKSSRRTYPVALAGAWRAPDGDIGIALASISPTAAWPSSRARVPAVCANGRTREPKPFRFGRTVRPTCRWNETAAAATARVLPY